MICSPSCLQTWSRGRLIFPRVSYTEVLRPRGMQVRAITSSRRRLTGHLEGLLHLLYSCVCMMFWRVFMRISYTCPAHLKFGLTVETWSTLVKLTGESIDWLDAHEYVYDVWLLVAYAATACALVQVSGVPLQSHGSPLTVLQYHTWARQQDPDAALKLRKLRDCVRRWERAISADHMSAKRKVGVLCNTSFTRLMRLSDGGNHIPSLRGHTRPAASPR